jgi:hypothetical protein
LKTVEPMEQAWTERVAEAALRAADELRALDDPTTFGLLADLDALHARLSAASGLDGEAA